MVGGTAQSHGAQEDDEVDLWACIMKNMEDSENKSKVSKDNDPDWVVVDKGDELDDDIFTQEGYGTL